MSGVSPSTVVPLHVGGVDGFHLADAVTWALVALVMVGLVLFASGRLAGREGTDDQARE